MKASVRYYTRSGNTEKLANAVAEAIGVPAEKVSVPLEEKVDLLFLGCSYYAFDVDDAVKKFILENGEKIGKIVCFGTSAMRSSMIKPVKKVADTVRVPVAAEEFHCRGAFGPAHRGRPNEKDCNEAAEFGRKMIG